jgi:hypothetical protein
MTLPRSYGEANNEQGPVIIDGALLVALPV